MWVRRDWSRVQAVTPGTRTTVLLYKDQAPRGKRKIEGHFHSATTEAVKLRLPHGPLRTVEKKAVRKVLVYRPLKKRYQGWVTAGVVTAILTGGLPSAGTSSEPLPTAAGVLLVGLVVGVPTVIAFLVAPKMGGIYNVPPDRRDPSNTKTTPLQNRSGATIPEVTESGGSPTGSELADRFLNKESGPDRLRQQARQALIRKGFPLHLPDLPVRGLSAERTGMQTTFHGSFLRADEVSRRAHLD